MVWSLQLEQQAEGVEFIGGRWQGAVRSGQRVWGGRWAAWVWVVGRTRCRGSSGGCSGHLSLHMNVSSLLLSMSVPAVTQGPHHLPPHQAPVSLHHGKMRFVCACSLPVAVNKWQDSLASVGMGLQGLAQVWLFDSVVASLHVACLKNWFCLHACAWPAAIYQPFKLRIFPVYSPKSFCCRCATLALHKVYSRVPMFWLQMILKPLPAGRGVFGSDLLSELCNLVGIKDLAVKVRGGTGTHSHPDRASFTGTIPGQASCILGLVMLLPLAPSRLPCLSTLWPAVLTALYNHSN